MYKMCVHNVMLSHIQLQHSFSNPREDAWVQAATLRLLWCRSHRFQIGSSTLNSVKHVVMRTLIWQKHMYERDLFHQIVKYENMS